jgi:transposase-like protein
VAPSQQFCHNPRCPLCGQVGQGNIRVHSQRNQRFKCARCGKTFRATRGTVDYRLRTAVDTVTLVLTVLCHGCPIQAIVAAFGFDERTIASWQARAGQHCQAVHAHLVEAGQVDVGHLQADELWVKLVGKKVWMALALAVPSRLWLGGVISAPRDLQLITCLVQGIRRCAVSAALLVCVDGPASYVTAFRRVFRKPGPTGRRGRPRLLAEPGLLIGQVVKQYAQRRVVSVRRRAVQGTSAAIRAVLAATHSGTDINTAYIERLNATFRSSLAPLARRGRAIARTEAVLTAGMYLVGCAYNFCWVHASLRQLAPDGARRQWQERVPLRWLLVSPITVGRCPNSCTTRFLCRSGSLPSVVADHQKQVTCLRRRWQHDHSLLWCYQRPVNVR